MCKDEVNYVRRAIESALPHVDRWCCMDTGSTDGTQDLVRELLKDLPGTLHQRPWKNWGASRTESINLAKESGADFVLIVDADQELHLEKMPELNPDKCYWTPVHSGDVIYSRGNLIHRKYDWHYVGVTHEFLTAAPDRVEIEQLPGYFLIHPDRILTSVERCTDDAKLLTEALQKEPNNTRYVHYLAQSYVGMGELEKALKTYEKRIRMGGVDIEEIWYCYYQVANIRRCLNYPREAVVSAYLRAHDFRPSRAESLRALAYYFNEKADEIPMPKDSMNLYPFAYKEGRK